jgi:serine/threonine protein kinase
MIVGIPPFFDKNKHKMYKKITSGELNFPDPIKHKIPMSENAKDLITKLLVKDYS